MKSRIVIRILILILGLFLVSSVCAHDADEADASCPICGYRFITSPDATEAVTVTRLDLKPPGRAHAPSGLSTCPKCGFVIYQEKIGADELANCREILSSPEFVKLRYRTPHRHLALIFEKLNKKSEDIGYAFLYASWEEEQSDGYYKEDLEKSLAHFKAFLTAAPPHDEAWRKIQMLAGEIQRLLGRFADSAGHFEGLSKLSEFQGDAYTDLIKFELGLCRRKDPNHYTTTDVRELKDAACRMKGCVFPELKLPASFAILAGGAPGRLIDYEIDKSGHQARQIDVVVNYTAKPVVLVLGTYEPTIWNIRRSTGTNIIAAVVSGVYRQALAGLDAGVPVLNITKQTGGPCGYFAVGQWENPDINPIARCLFGSPVDFVYLSKSAELVIGDDLPAGLKLITSTTNPPESFYDKAAAGKAVDKLVREGVLRKATKEDIDEWARAVGSRIRIHRDEPPVARVIRREHKLPRISNSYVVLKPFNYPSGLYGVNAVTFFIPRGVRDPEGESGDSTIYDFNTAEIRKNNVRHATPDDYDEL